MIDYSYESVLSTLETVKRFLNSAEFKPLNVSNGVDVENVNSKVDFAEYRLRKNRCVYLLFENTNLSPERLQKEWFKFSLRLSGVINDETKNTYGWLLKITLQFLNYIKSLPISYFINKMNDEEARSARVKDQNEEQKRLDTLKKRRLELKKQYEDALNESPVDQKKLSMLREKLEELGGAFI